MLSSLSMEMPAQAAYVLVFVLIAPALIGIGMFPLGTLMFVFHVVVMSFLTELKRLVSYAAASMAEFKTYANWVPRSTFGCNCLHCAFCLRFGHYIVTYRLAREGNYSYCPRDVRDYITLTGTQGLPASRAEVVRKNPSYDKWISFNSALLDTQRYRSNCSSSDSISPESSK